MSLPHGAVGSSAVCDWGIFWPFLLTFYCNSTIEENDRGNYFMINLRKSIGPSRDRTRYPGVASLIPALSHTFVEIDHERIFSVILLPSAESFKKGCCQLQAKVCARSTG